MIILYNSSANVWFGRAGDLNFQPADYPAWITYC